MLLLSARNLTKYFSNETVLDGACLEIRRGQHIGLVGPNGAGKTTLLNILNGQLDADDGTVSPAPSIKIGYLQQRFQPDATQTVWQFAETALRPLLHLARRADQVASQLAQCDDDSRAELERRFDHLHSELENRGGYQIDYRIRRVLRGLGFAEELDSRLISQLSGGQQNRLLLVRLLLEEPDLMLLDEPSNHLDIDATQWLEDFLAESTQAFLLVSHDRYFLDRVTTQTLELVNGKIDAFPGNYSKYKQLKRERLEVERRTFEKQQQEIEKLQDFIRRNHYGQKHAQAEDRRKKLERIEPVPVPREIPAPPMRFHEVKRTGDVVLRVEGLTKGYDFPLFSDLTFQIQRGQRWGILGRNGSGKTTLLRCLLNPKNSDSGTVRLGSGVQIGYFDQHLECIPNEVISAEAIRPRNERLPEHRLDEGQRRDLLARFGITDETALQPVRSLSGGQRNRVALANLAAQRANFLILDEPTNHLDLWARESLEKALTEFGGTVLLVSHDRYFLNRICDHLLVLQAGETRIIDGNYDAYVRMSKIGDQKPQENGSTTDQAGKPPLKAAKPKKPQKRKRKFPYRKIAEIEAEISGCESRIEQIHKDLSNPEFLRSRERVVEGSTQLNQLQERLNQLYEHWEEANELN